ncbi:MAG: gene transfer agent family protein [Methylocystis sp.]|uniref:gene transfer agent family protein n=1 Tax=Methylocystis sp. TaxID=1911079 RepID=UPI003DA52713
MQNSIDLKFADGDYTFALPLKQINELQRKTDIGIGGLLKRVMNGCAVVEGQIFGNPMLAEFYALDIIETIRQGLIGGNRGVVNGDEIEVSPVLAAKLIDAYVLSQPLSQSWNIAAAILGAAVIGYDPPKKDQPAAERAQDKPEKTRKKATSTTPAP